MNLLDETLETLSEHNLTIEDVKWIGSINGDYQCSINEFLELANREYDNGFGAPEVCGDLVIVGDDWWLERHEYDGSEEWEFKRLPKLKPEVQKIQYIFARHSVGWETLRRANSDYV